MQVIKVNFSTLLALCFQIYIVFQVISQHPDLKFIQHIKINLLHDSDVNLIII